MNAVERLSELADGTRQIVVREDRLALGKLLAVYRVAVAERLLHDVSDAMDDTLDDAEAEE